MIDNTPPRKLKPTPKAASRSQIYGWYKGLSTAEVRRAIQKAIEQVNLDNEIQTNPRAYKLNGHHIRLVFKYLDEPEGFEPLKIRKDV